MTSTIDPSEIEKFTKMADEWWDEAGKFKPLHKFNPCRIFYIKQKICDHFSRNHKQFDALKGLDIIDIGCGGGLIAEPFARMQANITAIDAGEKNIAVAKIHAEKSGLKIYYHQSTAEEFAATNQQFDVVLALEIIEHVADVAEFVNKCTKLLKPNGIMFIATLNRTAKSFLLAKIGAEYVLRWLPRGTHNFKKFLKPSEINNYAKQNNLQLQEITGFTYNLLNDSWKQNPNDLDVNYMMVFDKI